VTVTGSGFSGVTKVTFNGTPTQFRVVSSTSIVTVVPAGAATGPVAVFAPGGSGSSAVAFSVVR